MTLHRMVGCCQVLVVVFITIAVTNVVTPAAASKNDPVSVTPFTTCGGCSITNILWAPNAVVFLLTSDRNLFRSTDEGITWTLTKTLVAAIYQFPSNSSWVLAAGKDTNTSNPNYVLHLTSDGGASFTTYNFPTQNLQYLGLHPTIPGNIVALNYDTNPCCQVYVSLNGGAQWKLLSFTGFHVAWSFDPATPSTIFSQRSPGPVGYSSDYGANFTTLFPESFGFVLTPNFLWVGVPVSGEASLRGSSANVDPTHTLLTSYALCEFPFGDELSINGYTFLDDSTGAGYVGVFGQDQWGVIYTSEYNGALWIVSLPYAAQQSGAFDFETLGLDGMYIANSVINPDQHVNLLKTTVITFDNGGEWRYLVPPEFDSNGAPIICPNCTLNLHGITSYYFNQNLIPPFYSSPNAIGLIVAIGNVGKTLSNSINELSTFFSRDAGLTWFEISDEVTIYEFGDHGGILVWAPTAPTNTIWFSFDEGLTKQSYNFSTTLISVANIITEYGGSGRKFILYGSAHGINYIFGLDFTNAQPRLCGDGDYEIWQPSDGEHGKTHCFLGRSVSYIRRKRDADCYNNRDTDHIVNYTSCSCAFEDYECEFGYVASPRNATDGFTCTATAIPTPPPICPPGGNYTIPSGYHIVTDNVCVGGLNLQQPIVTPCPTTPTTSTTESATTSSATTELPTTTTSPTSATTSSSTTSATTSSSTTESPTTTSATTSATSTTVSPTTTTATTASATSTTSQTTTSSTTTAHTTTTSPTTTTTTTTTSSTTAPLSTSSTAATTTTTTATTTTTTSLTSTISTTSTPVPPPPDQGGGGNHTAAIVVPIVLVVVVSVGLALLLWRRPEIIGHFTNLFKRKKYESVYDSL